MENIKFDLNVFISSHPIGFTLLTIVIISIAILFLVELYLIIIHLIKRVKKIGPLELETEEEKIKNEVAKEAESLITKNKTQFLHCLEFVIDKSIQNGFERCLIRQRLFNKQVDYMEDRLVGIKNDMMVEYFNEFEFTAANMKHVEILIERIFNEKIYIPLERIFKADRLIEKPKDAIVEEHRHFISSIFTELIKKISEYCNDEKLVKWLTLSIKKRQDEIKKAVIDCIEKAYDFAKEEMNNMLCSRDSLNNEIKEYLKMYLGEDKLNNINIPSSWNDDLPPNDIIGDVR